jgi:hypothetical protein
MWALGNLILLAALVGLLAVMLRPVTMLLDHGQRALDYPYPLNYGEAPLLDQSLRLWSGANIYPADWAQPPYLVSNYPPLFPLVQAPLLEVFGIGFGAGRALSLVATAASAILLGLTAYGITRDLTAGIASGVVLLAVPYVLHWSALARVDMLALALSLAGLCAVAWRPRGRLNLALAVLLLALAAFTRQTYLLAAPLAAFAWLWGARERTRAFLLAAWLAALVLVTFASLLVLTDGGIWSHVITANVNTLGSDSLNFYLDELVRSFPILLIGAGLALLIGLIRAILRRDDDVDEGAAAGWMAGAYLVGAVGAALTIAKVGSDVNYLVELSAALCLSAGVLIAALRRVPLIKAAAVVALALQVLLLMDLSETKYYRIVFERTSAESRAGVETLLTRLGELPSGERVLADEYLGLLILRGVPLEFQPFEMSQLALAGVWDESPFVAALRRGDYPTLLLYQPMMNPSLRFERWTPEMLRAINELYRPDGQAAETTIYRYVGQ